MTPAVRAALISERIHPSYSSGEFDVAADASGATDHSRGLWASWGTKTICLRASRVRGAWNAMTATAASGHSFASGASNPVRGDDR